MRTRFILLLLLPLSVTFATLNAQTNGQGALLRTVGAQGGALMYNTYCFIGALHDGYINGAWEKEFVSSLLIEQSALLSNVSEEYDSLLVSGCLDYEDSVFVAGMNDALGLLKNEAITLEQYITDGTDESNQRYMDARDAAWNKISELLGFDEDNSAVTMKNHFSGI